MRLAIDFRSVAETGGQISGVENYFVNIYNRLEPYIGPLERLPIVNRYKPVILPPELQMMEQVTQTHIPNKIFNSLQFIAHQPKFERLYGDFDVLWLPDIRPFSVQKSTKVALTVHDLSPLTNPEYYSMRRRIWHAVTRYRQAIRRADLIFAVSAYTKQDIVRLVGVDPKKIVVAYPGVDMSRFKPLSEHDPQSLHAVRVRYDLPERYALILSTIEPRKNIASVISAFENTCAARHTHMHLVIAGKLGWLYQPIIDRIRKSSLRDRIHVLGYIDERDKPYLLAMAEMLCYPSFHEGFGFQPLEAMASGVPVIASARTSLPEVCGDAGVLVEPNHPESISLAIDQLVIGNPDDSGDVSKRFRQILIEKGLRQARKFDWHHTARLVYDGCMDLAATTQNPSRSERVR